MLFLLDQMNHNINEIWPNREQQKYYEYCNKSSFVFDFNKIKLLSLFLKIIKFIYISYLIFSQGEIIKFISIWFDFE